MKRAKILLTAVALSLGIIPQFPANITIRYVANINARFGAIAVIRFSS